MATIRVLPWARVKDRSGKQYVEFAFAVDVPAPSGLTKQIHKISGRYSALRKQYKPIPPELLPGCRAHFPDKVMRGGPNDRNLHRRARELAGFFSAIITDPEMAYEDEVINAVLCRLGFSDAAAKTVLTAREGGAPGGGKRVLVYENQRAGGVSEVLSLDNPEERLFSSTKLERSLGDPPEWSSEKRQPRADPTDGKFVPPPGWMWGEPSWTHGAWEYANNFVAPGSWAPELGQASGLTLPGTKRWVRRRPWFRIAQPDPACLKSGWLDKKGGKGRWARRWFVLTAAELAYYKPAPWAASGDYGFGVGVVSPPAARNGGKIDVGCVEGVELVRAGERRAVVSLSTAQGLVCIAGAKAVLVEWAHQIQAAAGRELAALPALAGQTDPGGRILKSGLLQMRVGTCAHWQRGVAVLVLVTRKGHGTSARDGHGHLLFYVQKEDLPSTSNADTDSASPELTACVPLEDVTRMESKGCPKSESCRVANRSVRFGLWLDACRAESMLRLGFAQMDARDEWFVAISEAGSAAGLGWQRTGAAEQTSSVLVRQQPTDPADIARRDRNRMPVLQGPSAFDVRIEPNRDCVGRECAQSDFIQETYHLLLKPDYIAAFFSYEDAQKHVESPCTTQPKCKFQLQGATCELSGGNIVLRDSRKLLTIQPCSIAAGSEGPTDTAAELQVWFDQLTVEMDHIARGGIYRARAMGADMPTAYAVNAQVRAIFRDATTRDQAMAPASAAAEVSSIGEVAASAQPSTASADAVDTSDQVLQQRKTTLASFVKRIVDMDWNAYEHMTMPGSSSDGRLTTPALISLLDMLNDTLNAGGEAAVELFGVVVNSLSEELESQLQKLQASFATAGTRATRLSTRSYSSDDSNSSGDLGVDHRAHLLAWVNNLAILAERTDALQEKYDLDDFDGSSTDFFKLAKNCAKFAQQMIMNDFEQTMNDPDRAIFASLDSDASPVSDICEELFDLCIVDLKLQLSGHTHSLTASRLFRGMVDYLVHTLCNAYIIKLADRCRSLGGLQQFRHLIEADVKHVQTLIDDMGIEFIESCASIVADGGSTKVLKFTGGLDSVHGTRFPVIASKVKEGSDAARVGARRGVTIVGAVSGTGQRLRAEEICSGTASITILRPTPEISFALLQLRCLANTWQCTHDMADALGSSTKFVQAYEAMCHIQPACAFKLAYVASQETPGLLKTLSKVDTAKITASLCPMARKLNGSTDFQTAWWNNEHGPPSVMASQGGTQFITVINQTDTSLRLATATTFQQCKWWQEPPAQIGARETFTWGAYTEGHGPLRSSDNAGICVFDVRSDQHADPEGGRASVVFMWSYPLLEPLAGHDGFFHGRKTMAKVVPTELTQPLSRLEDLYKSSITEHAKEHRCFVVNVRLSHEIRTRSGDEHLQDVHHCVFTVNTLTSEQRLRHRQMVEVLARLLESDLIADRRDIVTTHPQCFIGSDFVKWLVAENIIGCTDREHATRVGQDLLDWGMIQHVTNRHGFMDSHDKKDFYRVISKPYTSSKELAGTLEVKRNGLVGGWFSARWFELDHDGLCEFKRRYEAVPSYTLPLAQIQGVEQARSSSTVTVLARSSKGDGAVEKLQLRCKTEEEAQEWSGAIEALRVRTSLRSRVFLSVDEVSDRQQGDGSADADEDEATPASVVDEVATATSEPEPEAAKDGMTIPEAIPAPQKDARVAKAPITGLVSAKAANAPHAAASCCCGSRPSNHE